MKWEAYSLGGLTEPIGKLSFDEEEEPLVTLVLKLAQQDEPPGRTLNPLVYLHILEAVRCLLQDGSIDGYGDETLLEVLLLHCLFALPQSFKSRVCRARLLEVHCVILG